MALKIVILEDNEERQAIMRACLEDRFYMYEHRFFVDAAAMIHFLNDHLAEAIVISLDHDLDGGCDEYGRLIDVGTGRDVADYLATHVPVCPVVIHTSNSDCAIGMEQELHAARWQTRRVVPFDDLTWIEQAWFPVIRRIIVGSIPQHGVPVAPPEGTPDLASRERHPEPAD
jgi:hypothetical protein